MKLSNKQIVIILIRAKETYKEYALNGYYTGMCEVIFNSLCYDKYGIKYYNQINSFIPKFNTKFLKPTYPYGSYWWGKYDMHSRIDAFNKLINYYKRMEDKDFEKISKNKYSL